MQIVRRPDPDTKHLPDDMHPLLKRVYAARDIRDPGQLDYSLSALLPGSQLHGIDAAVALLRTHIEAGRRILIVADFDADGATACALAVRGLTAMGAHDVRYVVPNRFEYGYGLSPEIVTVAAEQQPDLVVTVDNGIASVSGVAAAQARGMEVIITDHHLPPAELPAADAIVNPNLPGDPFPSKCLAGVGVMFYVLIALRSALRDDGWFERRNLEVPNLAQWLDLIALGTVADVVPLDHNNRILVAQGLKRIRASACCAGIRALLAVAGRDAGRATAMDFGFFVAPRLNAAGRLTDMTLGIECLLTDSDSSAREMAGQLDALNRERRELQNTMHEDAEQHLGELGLDADSELPAGLCLYREDWHQGLVGLVAARVKDQVQRPVIAFAPAGDGENLKGSARSIPGVHVRDVLDALATRHPGLVSKFGGHAMAAGLSLPASCYEAFAGAFASEVASQLGGEIPVGQILSDGDLNEHDGGELSLRTAELIAEAGPWGQGFPEPLFDGEFEVVERRVVGGRHLSLKLKPLKASATTRPIKAIAFGTDDSNWPARVERVAAAYRLDIDNWGGRRQLQLMIEYLTPLGV